MEVFIRDRKAYFIVYSDEEIRWVMDKLTFTKTWGKTTTVIKLYWGEGPRIFTFAGLLKPIRQQAPFPVILQNPRRVEDKKLDVDPNLLRGKTLHEFQVEAIRRSVLNRRGVLKLPTGSGKTIIKLGLLRYLMNKGLIKHALITVPSLALAEQFRARALECGYHESGIGVVHGKIKEHGRPITVAVSKSIFIGIDKENPEVMDLIQKTDFLGLDEAHHGRADTWLRIIHACKHLRYLIGLSATPFHNENVLDDAGDAILQGVTGGSIFSVSPAYVRSLGFTSLPICHFENMPGRKAKHRGRFSDIYKKHIVRNETRNKKIIDWCYTFLKFQFSVLILVQQREHAEILLRKLPREIRSIGVFGNNSGMMVDDQGLSQDLVIDYDQFSTDFENGIYSVVVATQVFDEGVDLPSVGAVIMAGGGKSVIKVNQRVGRGSRRKAKGPNQFYLVDFIDNPHVYLSSQSYKRKKLYEEELEAKIIREKSIFWLEIKKHWDQLRSVEQ